MRRQGLVPLLLAGTVALAAIGGSPARADGAGAVLRTARVGTEPRAIAIDTVTGRAFVANYGGNSVSMLDVRTGRVLRTIPLAASSHPRRIAVDERSGHVFVESVGPLDSSGALTGAGAVAMLDATTGAMLGSAAVGRGPLALAVDSRTSRVFAANYDDNTVSLISAVTGHLLGTANVGNSPIAFAVDALRGH